MAALIKRGAKYYIIWRKGVSQKGKAFKRRPFKLQKKISEILNRNNYLL